MEIRIPPGQGQEGDTCDLAQLDQPARSSVTDERMHQAAVPVQAESSESAAGMTWKEEDQTFPGSDIAITIVLFREDGHPDGRLVQITVQDFRETRVTKAYRAHQLTTESELDALQTNGLNDVVQQFWLRLEDQRKKAAEGASQHKRAPARVSAATSPSVSVPSASPAPTPARAKESPPMSAPAPVPVAPAASKDTTTQLEFF